MDYSDLKQKLKDGWRASDAHEEGRMLFELKTTLPSGHLLKDKEFTVDALRIEGPFDLLCQDAREPGLFTVVRFAPNTTVHLAVLFHGSFQGFLENEDNG
jgi:hypothetical protein